jgi:signal transduction histidine kinase
MLDDLKLGREAMIRKKLNYLVKKGLFNQVAVKAGDISIETSVEEQRPTGFSILQEVLSPSSFLISLPLTDSNNTNWGTIEGKISSNHVLSLIDLEIRSILIITIGLCFALIGVILFVSDRVVAPILNLTASVRSKLRNDIPYNENEIDQLKLAFKLYDEEITRAKIAIADHSRLEAMSNIARQVSHDIRSPLSALNIVVSTITQIPDQSRTIIRDSLNRINDIANDLLQRNSRENYAISNLNSEMMAAVLETIVLEKRIQFQDRPEVSISLDIGNAFNVFSEIRRAEFKRVLSNLINNSIESLNSLPGEIRVGLKCDETQVEISVCDSGIGIPSEILEKLGLEEVTHGKNSGESGYGLGISHAVRTVESFGGTLKILSEVNKGTTIRILLPKCENPAWFIPEIPISFSQKIIVCDDDTTVHRMWDELLVSHHLTNQEILHFISPTDFSNWLKQNPSYRDIVVLMDYEFLGEKVNGIDLIREFNLEQRSILVTSHYEDFGLQQLCTKHQVKMLPKCIAHYIGVRRGKSTSKVDVQLSLAERRNALLNSPNN